MPEILSVAGLLEKNIPGARRVTVAGADHALNMEKAEEFTRLVLEFIAAPGKNREHDREENAGRVVLRLARAMTASPD